jgi:hypothetical protein
MCMCTGRGVRKWGTEMSRKGRPKPQGRHDALRLGVD